MTTLIAFVSVDSRGPTGLYIASDSRITFEPERPSKGHIAGQVRWDAGRKLFASRNHADVFGYAGDVLFPVMALTQTVEAADYQILFSENCGAENRHRSYYTALRRSFAARLSTPNYNFSIIHGARENSGMSANFRAWLITYFAHDNSWADIEIDLKVVTSLKVLAIGTGATTLNDYDIKEKYKPQGMTTRAVFWAFCDALRSGGDPLTGGAPQLVSLYRVGSPNTYGIISNGQRYVNGLQAPDGELFDHLEWRDELFQRVNRNTLGLITGAQPQPR